MIERKTYSTTVGGKTLTVEISSIAEQANAAVIATYGETVVLATAVMAKTDASVDYLPLKIDYEERFYAVGKILGSRYVRREGRASEEAILAGRLVDRTIRPLFDQRIRRDIQVVLTVLAYDGESEPEFAGLIAASVALGMSDIPWGGPVAGVRVAKVGDALTTNPSAKILTETKSTLDAFAAGPRDHINMIELAGNEAQEDEIVAAFVKAQEEINTLITFQEGIIKEIGKPKEAVKLAEADEALKKLVRDFLGTKLESVMYPHLARDDKKVRSSDKREREENMAALRVELFDEVKRVALEKGEPADIPSAEFLIESMADELVHKNILGKDLRPDGRKLDEVRELNGEVGLFKRTHGSALFVRGNTQALAITTLAAPGSEQVIESMETANGKRRFMLHYNFPPFSVGETGRLGAPGRREIGHGALAYKAVLPLIPPQDVFPYTVRVVSEILSSNGSSSMATVCATVLSLMDAGVPIKKPAAGIAMGLMMQEERSEERGERKTTGKYKVLTDIQGPEDHYGDMDFKVAGTRDGVNAVQLDVKVHGLTSEVIKETLAAARKARLHILDAMQSILAAPRPDISPLAPMIAKLQINPEKIGMVIGPGGKMINGLIEHFKLESIDIEEDGWVFVSAHDKANMDAAIAEIKGMTREFTVGEIIEGRVIKVLEFGAIVDLGAGKDGMIHVSELKNGFVKDVTEVVHEGDIVRAKIVRVDVDGRIGLSMKQLSN